MKPMPQAIVRVQSLQEAVYDSPSSVDEAMEVATEDLNYNDFEMARIIAAFNNGMGQLQLADSHSTVMTSVQDGVASRIQAAAVAFAEQNGKFNRLRPAQSRMQGGLIINQPELLEVQFDSTDVFHWIKMWAQYMIFKPRRANWISPPTLPASISNNATIAVFGDWGSGLYGSIPIRDRINEMINCEAVIHLGDTYYAGAENEVARRLVGNWPTGSGRGRCLHRTLNGNHEMYSGANAYFAALQLPPFADQQSSCFAFQNDNWLLLGLDTSFTWGNSIGDIDEGQKRWIEGMIGNAKSRKVILFSHHQIFSKFDDVGSKLRDSLGSLLQENRIYGWYFGHEHRLVIFNQHPKWGLKARCMGHGGFPEFRKTDLPGFDAQKSQWIELPETADVPGAQLWDGPNVFIDDDPTDPEKYVPHGYLSLEFSGKDLYETFLDPAGHAVRDKRQL